MTDKPTHEELMERIRELEKKDSERQLEKEELLKSRAMFETIVENLPFDVFALDPDSRYILQNSICEKNWGNVIGKSPEDLPVNKKTKDLWMDNNRRALLGETVTGEVVYERLDGGKNFYYNIISPIRDGETIRGVLGVLLDISELKKAEDALIDSEERYKSLFIKNHSVMLLVDPESADIVDANPAATSFYEWSYEKLIRKKITDINTLTKRQVFQEMKRAKTEKRLSFHFKHRLASGKIRDVEVYSGPIKVYGRELLFSIIHDITKRKQAEEALKESEARYRDIFENVSDFLYFHDLEGYFLEVNSAFRKESGYSNEEITNLNIIDLMPEEYKHVAKNYFKAVMKNGKDEGLMSVMTKSGRKLIVEYKNSLVYDSTEPIAIRGSARDITERKLAEEELQKLASVVRYSSELVNLANLDGKMIFLNKAGNKILGIDPDEVERFHIMEVIPDHLKEKVQTEILSSQSEGSTWEGDLQYRNIKTGKITDVHAMTFTIQEPNTKKPLFLANLSIDISDRKRAEEAVRDSEKKYRLLVNNIPGIVYKGFEDWSVEFYDNKIERMTGYNIQKFNSGRMKWIDLMVKDDIEPSREIFIRALKTDKSYVRDFRIKTKSKDILWIQERGQIVCDDNGKIEYVSGVFFDITETKKALVALQESEATLKSIFRAAPIGIGMVCDRVMMQVNDRLCDMLGYSREKLLGKSARMVYPTDEDFEYVGREKYLQIHDRGSGTVETRLQRRDGNLIDVLLNSAPIDPKNLSKGLTFTALNITSRKKAEEALRKSEEKYHHLYKLMRLIADNMPDLIWAKDMDGRYVFVNQAMCDKLIMCDCPDEAVGMTDMIIAEQERNAGYEHTFSENFVNSDVIIHERKVACRLLEEGFIRNKYLVLDVHKAPFLNENKEMIGTVGCGRDVTNEKKVEKALKEREIELERKNLRLEELNSALKILLEKRDGDKKVLEEKVLMNIKNLILPYLAKLKKTTLDDRQEIFLEIIQSNVEDILSPFAHKLSFKYLNFTPTELQVADFVKQGLRTKEIADLLNSSPETVSGHRKNMRKKLNLKDKKSNLRTHLLSLD